MLKSNKIVLAGMLALGSLAALPAPAQAHGRWSHGARYDDDVRDGPRGRWERGYQRPAPRYAAPAYRQSCRSGGTTGLVVGGALGALVGRGLDRSGDRATGTILGAGGGALLGHHIDRNRNCR